MKVTSPHYPAFLKEDVAAAHTFEVEDFFRTVLGVSNAWVDAHHGTLKEILQGRDYRDAVMSFMDRCGRAETFEGLLDRASSLLEKEGLLDAVPAVAFAGPSQSSPASPTLDETCRPGLVVLVGPSSTAQTCDQAPEPASRSPAHQTTEYHLQLANVAHTCMSYGSWQDFVVGVIVTEDTIEMAYFDHSVIIFSRGFSIIQQPTLFLTMICGIGKLYAECENGVPRSINTIPCVEHSTLHSDVRVRLSNGSLLRLGEILHQQPGLVGRATCVVRVSQLETGEGPDWSGKKLIMKISWPPAVRMSEVDIIEMARGKAIETGQDWVLAHLPAVLHCQEYSEMDELLRQRLMNWFGGADEGRVLRMVVEEELRPMSHLDGPIELGMVINDIFRCTCTIFFTSSLRFSFVISRLSVAV